MQVQTAKGILDYIPLINLGATIVAIIGAFFFLKFALSQFQDSVRDLKSEVHELADEMRDKFDQFGTRFGSVNERLARVEATLKIAPPPRA